MKQELPIAITLLAAGCLLWLWQSKEASEASATIQRTAEQTEATGQTLLSVSANTANRFAAPTSGDVSGSQLLDQISDSLRNGPSLLGDMEIKNYLFAKDQTIKARFWNQGGGSQQARLELILSSRNPTKMTQVCDGRFLYLLTEQLDERTLKFHDLRRLNNEDARIVKATLPAAWVGTGSLGGLFSNLSEAFNFGDLKSLPNEQRVELVGTWNPTHLSKLMVNRVDHRQILPTPDWSKLPPQIPHGVRLRFLNSADFGWQPDEIVYFKFDPEREGKPLPMISIKFVQIQYQAISADLFQLDSDEASATDETDLYNHHIELIVGNHRVAEESSDAIR